MKAASFCLVLAALAFAVPLSATAGNAPVKAKVALPYFTAICEAALPNFKAVDALALKSGLKKARSGYVHPDHDFTISVGDYGSGRPLCAIQFRTSDQQSVVYTEVNRLKSIVLSTDHGPALLYYRPAKYIAALTGNDVKKTYTLSLVGTK